MIVLLSGGYFWLSLLLVIFLLAFAYIVMAHASREKGVLKKTGIALAVVIFTTALIVLVYGTVYCGMLKKSCYIKYEKFSFNKGVGLNVDLSTIRDEEVYNLLKDILKRPGMSEWIQEYINESGSKK